ncbi:hypothetical protein SAR06_004946 [Escherichia coli]|nr:hypothetical protein [Escherichia coli]
MANDTITAAKQAESRSPAFTVMCGGYAQNQNMMDSFNHTDNVAIFFDAVTDVRYSFPVEKSSYAAEDGTTLSDHAVIKDKSVSFTGVITSSPHIIRRENYIDRNTNPDNPRESARPAAAVRALMEMRDNRQIVTLVSEDAGLLENFIMTKCEVKRSSSSGDCITIDCTFEEFRTFKVKMVENAGVFTNTKKVGKTQQKGAVNSVEKDSNVGNSTNTPTAKPKDFKTLLDENGGSYEDAMSLRSQQRQSKFAKDATK